MWWTSPNEKRAASNYEEMTDEAMNQIYMPTGYEPINANAALDLMPQDNIEDDEELVR
jgi:hypothetical protein